MCRYKVRDLLTLAWVNLRESNCVITVPSDVPWHLIVLILISGHHTVGPIFLMLLIFTIIPKCVSTSDKLPMRSAETLRFFEDSTMTVPGAPAEKKEYFIDSAISSSYKKQDISKGESRRLLF